MTAISIRAKLRERKRQATKYPVCWDRVTTIIRRLASGTCERCGQPCKRLEVHHIGSPYADGRPGDPRDKHDIRRENLTAICHQCHNELEHVDAIRKKAKTRKKKRKARLEAHRALGVGTGLVVVPATNFINKATGRHAS
jgi:5-methylcytosine-specific restriction endonuclease McrA